MLAVPLVAYQIAEAARLVRQTLDWVGPEVLAKSRNEQNFLGAPNKAVRHLAHSKGVSIATCPFAPDVMKGSITNSNLP